MTHQKIQGTVCHKTHLIRGWLKSTSPRFLKKLNGGSLKTFFPEFSWTETRILGALSKLDEFLLNPQVQTCSIAVPGTSRNNSSENWEPTGDRSIHYPCPEAMFSACHTKNLNDSEQDETHHMVTGVQEGVPYCSPGTLAGKQKKARSTSQPQFRSENTPATIEADQIFLALQQGATNSYSANFNSNINRISKLLKSLTTTMPTFDGKSEKFELFEDLFQTSFEIHKQLTDEDKIKYFHSLMRGDAPQTFKSITSLNRETLGEILTVFCRKYVKPQSMATAKHNFQRLVFNPVNQKLVDFLDELQKLAKDAFGVAAQVNIEQFIYASKPPSEKANQPGTFGEWHI